MRLLIVFFTFPVKYIGVYVYIYTVHVYVLTHIARDLYICWDRFILATFFLLTTCMRHTNLIFFKLNEE